MDIFEAIILPIICYKVDRKSALIFLFSRVVFTLLTSYTGKNRKKVLYLQMILRAKSIFKLKNNEIIALTIYPN